MFRFNKEDFMEEKPLVLDDLLKFGSLKTEMKWFLECAVKGGCNILISAGTGGGKSSLLHALGNVIPPEETVALFDEIGETTLNRDHFISLPFRNQGNDYSMPSAEVIGNTVGFFFKTERPSCILFDDIRDGGAYELITGAHLTDKQIIASIHSNSPKGAFERLSLIAEQTSFHFVKEDFERTLSKTIDLVVQVRRLKDGSRKITAVSQINSETFEPEGLFKFDTEGEFIRTDVEAKAEINEKIK